MELLALSSLLNGMPILVLGPGSDPTAVGDRARPFPLHDDGRIALWFSGGHYEFILSDLPGWMWQAVWRDGDPEHAQGTTSVPHPAMPIAPPQFGDVPIQWPGLERHGGFCEALVAKVADTLPPSPAPLYDMRHHVASLPGHAPCFT